MAADRRRSFGCIQNLGKGSDGLTRWRLRWSAGGRRLTEVVHGSRRDAERRMAEIHAETASERRSSATVGMVWEECVLADLAHDVAPSTRRNIEANWRNHVCPRWSAVPVADVRAYEVEAWLSKLPNGAASIALSSLRRVMGKAVMRGDIAASPLSVPIRLPAAKLRTHDRKIIRSGSLEDYAAAVRGSVFEAAWILGACGGLRPGEMLGVKVGEVERFDQCSKTVAVVQVRREAMQYGGVAEDDREGRERERVKTASSRRIAVIPDPYASRLLVLQDEARERGDVFLTDDGLGMPLGTEALRHGLDRLYSAAGLQRILPRNLRPSFATDAHSRLGLPTEDIARLMGHSRPIMTWSVYERPNASELAAIVAAAMP